MSNYIRKLLEIIAEESTEISNAEKEDKVERLTVCINNLIIEESESISPARALQALISNIFFVIDNTKKKREILYLVTETFKTAQEEENFKELFEDENERD